MEKEIAQKLVSFLTDAGEEAKLYENYSGRFMYGSTTTGVVIEQPTRGIQEFLIEMILELDDGEIEEAGGLDEFEILEAIDYCDTFHIDLAADMVELAEAVKNARTDNLAMDTIIY